VVRSRGVVPERRSDSEEGVGSGPKSEDEHSDSVADNPRIL